MYPSALLLAGVFAAFGVAHVRYPDRIYEFRHRQLTTNPQLSTKGRRRYEFRGALFFLFAFVSLLMAFAD